MKIRLIVFLLFIFSNQMFSQCNEESSFILNNDSIDCCNKLDRYKDETTLSDTTTFMYLYYQLICEQTVKPEEYNRLIDSFYIIDEKLKYSGSESDNWKFRSRQRKNIQFAKRRILEIGYNKSLNHQDFLRASDYAKKLKQCYPYWGDNEIKKAWGNRELTNYEKYANNKVVKLIEYHSNWLFRDTTRMMISNPPFFGYDYLINTISSQYQREEFKNELEEAITNSKLTKGINRGRPQYKLEFKLENETFELYDDEISILYYSDTILIDTVTTWNCFGGNASIDAIIEIKSDTIKQQISNPNDIEKYKARFRRTLLYNIIDKLEN